MNLYKKHFGDKKEKPIAVSHEQLLEIFNSSEITEHEKNLVISYREFSLSLLNVQAKMIRKLIQESGIIQDLSELNRNIQEKKECTECVNSILKKYNILQKQINLAVN